MQEPSIHNVIHLLKEHFEYPYKGSGALRLHVIAIHSLCTTLLPGTKRYADKRIAPLDHSNMPSDIVILDKAGKCFEVFEVKYTKPITVNAVNSAYRKIKNMSIVRYTILTTCKPECINAEKINSRIELIAQKYSCEIFIDNTYSLIAHWLRAVSDSRLFLDKYAETLCSELDNGNITSEHLQVWAELRKTL